MPIDFDQIAAEASGKHVVAKEAVKHVQLRTAQMRFDQP